MSIHIGILTGRTAYPNGMAACQRIHLMARAMAEAGATVNVWVDGFDEYAETRNLHTEGERDNIPYKFVLGRTRASRCKWRRVLDRFTLAWYSRRMLGVAADNQLLDGLYFYTSKTSLDFERAVVWDIARKKRFPIVVDLCEAPWTFKAKQSFIEKNVSPLWGTDGVICISKFLEDWVIRASAKTCRDVQSLYVPILVDVNEIEPVDSAPTCMSVLFSGAPQYDLTIRFLLAAMEVVWAKYPNCSLVITGGTTEATLGPLAKGQGGMIRYAGYVDRRTLLQELSAASVLAIPLFDEFRSQARFPTKLGEYLATGRPVVTNKVGEVSNYLKDGESAWVLEPGNSDAFGKAICQVLSNQSKAHEIGQNGRKVAEREFHYSIYGPKLIEFFTRLSSLIHAKDSK